MLPIYCVLPARIVDESPAQIKHTRGSGEESRSGYYAFLVRRAFVIVQDLLPQRLDRSPGRMLLLLPHVPEIWEKSQSPSRVCAPFCPVKDQSSLQSKIGQYHFLLSVFY